MLDLMTGTSHQLFLTPYETTSPDLRFLQVLFDEESQRYTIITIHKSDTKEEEEAGVGFAEHLAKQELILHTFLPEFTLGIKQVQDNTLQGRIVLK